MNRELTIVLIYATVVVIVFCCGCHILNERAKTPEYAKPIIAKLNAEHAAKLAELKLIE